MAAAIDRDDRTVDEKIELLALAYRCSEVFSVGDSSSSDTAKRGMPRDTLYRALDALLTENGCEWRSLISGGQAGKLLNTAVQERLEGGERPLDFPSPISANNAARGHVGKALHDISNQKAAQKQLPGSAASTAKLKNQASALVALSASKPSEPFIFSPGCTKRHRNILYREGLVINASNVRAIGKIKQWHAPYRTFDDSQCSPALSDLMRRVGNVESESLVFDVAYQRWLLNRSRHRRVSRRRSPCFPSCQALTTSPRSPCILGLWLG
ncbi:hypothetical protein KFL_000380385 [Klebsormidium nitens]|uniref:Uncharacterized protein n=1 Tax=Klebsormidium nitens TaxID=105231 RepID=A0A1Y1HVE4_KLENI|nr:hypothetical protein KFL_000380385 [Klebsormidium nitens]|eukprot:GAQ79808.1 hypothetical protein KFL_000380385 [Klebsormidium nitens]